VPDGKVLGYFGYEPISWVMLLLVPILSGAGNAITVSVATDHIKDPGLQAKSWWFNPRDGSVTLIRIFPVNGTRKLSAPDANEWVLVIDSLAAELPSPGSRNFL
jgi:Putative collagen-binding domain of a collagenase